MYLTLEALSAAAVTDTQVAELTAILAGGSTNFLSLSSYLGEDNKLDTERVIQAILKNADYKIEDLQPKLNYYDQLKVDYFKPDHKFMTLADVKVPKGLQVGEALKSIEGLKQKLGKDTALHLDLLNTNSEIKHIGNAFAIPNDDASALFLNHAAIAQRLEFLEFVKGIKLEDIQRSPQEVAMKIMAAFIETSKPMLNPPKEQPEVPERAC